MITPSRGKLSLDGVVIDTKLAVVAEALSYMNTLIQINLPSSTKIIESIYLTKKEFVKVIEHPMIKKY